MTIDLPVTGAGAPREREDAARNRARVVDAAARLFRGCEDVERVDMRSIAAEAGVGVGTLYRRFGDKAALAAAVLDDHARALQQAILSGPPPLGPGAPADERLEAFLRALVEHTEKELDLVYAVEHSLPGGRFALGPYPAWHLHTTVLLRELVPDGDHAWLADAVLAPLSSTLYRHQRRDRGLSPAQIADQLTRLARAVYGSR
ncbi:MAG TPA: helix-turn-helix domain-containing protein [Solirubrobacteraceae bacterium]|nr:helix-turn-helix domain-containing protein [Solirubrobacteraceae bacterium]